MGMPEDDRNKKTAKKNKDKQNPLTPDDDEMPEHTVTISYDFAVSKFAVTQKLWASIVGTNPSFFQDDCDEHPVERVSWLDCVAFCNKLSIENGLDPVYYIEQEEQEEESGSSASEASEVNDEDSESRESSDESNSEAEVDTSTNSAAPINHNHREPVNPDYMLDGYQIGHVFSDSSNEENFELGNDLALDVKMNLKANGYRLITEAEWEYVARAGQLSEKFDPQDTDEENCDQYPEHDNLRNIAFFIENSFLHTQKVGQLKANSFGVYDMFGNVWEWCWDHFGSYSSNDVIDPVGRDFGSSRVIRGGAWNCNKEKYLRITSRGAYTPAGRSNNIGFRLARTLR